MSDPERLGIRAVTGGIFPDNNGQDLANFAAILEFDSACVSMGTNQWSNVTGYEIAGWSIAAGEAGGALQGGKQAVFFLDSDGNLVTRNQFGITVTGAGTQVNNVTRVKKLNDGALMVANRDSGC